MKSVGDRRGFAKTLNVLGDITLGQGEYVVAGDLYKEVRKIFADLDDWWWLAWSLEGLAGVDAARGQFARDYGIHPMRPGLRRYRVLSIEQNRLKEGHSPEDRRKP